MPARCGARDGTMRACERITRILLRCVTVATRDRGSGDPARRMTAVPGWRVACIIAAAGPGNATELLVIGSHILFKLRRTRRCASKQPGKWPEKKSALGASLLTLAPIKPDVFEVVGEPRCVDGIDQHGERVDGGTPGRAGGHIASPLALRVGGRGLLFQRRGSATAINQARRAEPSDRDRVADDGGGQSRRAGRSRGSSESRR